MGLAVGKLSQVPGLTFGRLMGSGGGNGFALSPNFGLYAWLGCWESKAAAEAFFAEHPWWKKAEARAHQIDTHYLQPTMAHGAWGGQNPFQIHQQYDPSKPIAVITRATIRTRKLFDFWRYVPRTSASIYDHPARKFSVGIGEYPIFMQATFSLWESGKAMQAFAYQSKFHKEVVKLTRERNWYKEELFARFEVVDHR